MFDAHIWQIIKCRIIKTKGVIMPHIVILGSMLNDDRKQGYLKDALALKSRLFNSSGKSIEVMGLTQNGWMVPYYLPSTQFLWMQNMTKDDLNSILNKGEFVRLLEIDETQIGASITVADMTSTCKITMDFQSCQILYGTHGEELVLTDDIKARRGYDW